MKNYSMMMLALTLCVLLGCGKGYVPMSGTVTFSDNGSPLPRGTVVFVSGPHFARGHLDEQGHYTVSFDSPGSGLPKGTYEVYVTDALAVAGYVREANSTGISERPTYKNLIDTKFNSVSTSGLSLVVDGSSKTFDFKVDRSKH